jgi:predicted nucleic-acid-binding Zn-ribbon protein
MFETMLSISCPKCDHDQARLSIKSKTLITVSCGRCDYSWVVDLATMPQSFRDQVPVYPIERQNRRAS